MMRLRSAATAFIVLLGFVRPVSAQDRLGGDGPSTAPPPASGTEQAVIAKYWELGRERSFLAGTIEAGYAYVRPRFAVGWGKPYLSWIGVEAYPMLSTGGVGHYTGIAAALPGVAFRAGGRYYFPFSRTFLLPKRSFSRADVDSIEGPRADYVAFEAELTGTAPVLGGSAFGVLTAYRTTLVPEGYYLFEESLHAVMEPPYLLRARLGYLLALSRNGAIRVGATAETIVLPGRDELIVRAGVLGSVLIDAHIEAQASFVPVIVSPDDLGVLGGDFGQLGVLVRWATGSQPVKPQR